MTECDWCGDTCDKSVGCSRELKTVLWGSHHNVTYSPVIVNFFCKEEHRSKFLTAGIISGDIQTARWSNDYGE